MKKICFVNCASTGSTGTIVFDIAKNVSDIYSTCFVLGEKKKGFEKNVLYSSETRLKYVKNRIQTFLLGNDGFVLGADNRRLIKFLEKEKPDLIHINNIHRSFSNLETLINYCKKNGKQIIWTLHDAWMFTGRCCYFNDCLRWEKGCGNCRFKGFYPRSFFDFSKKYWIKKHSLIRNNLSIITFVSPSKWLFDIVNSQFPNSNIRLIRNGVDQSIFKPTLLNSFITQNKKDKFVIGCVANNLSTSKGFDDIVTLSNMVKQDDNIVIFVIGADIEEEAKKINDNLFVIKKTSSKKEMASFYSSIDVLFDPTKADNYPTTHIECLSCGTPIVTYDVGGAAESIVSGINGYAIKKGDFKNALKLFRLIKKGKLNKQIIINEAKNHDYNKSISEYLTLYNETLKKF